MNPMKLDHPIALALAENRHAERFFDLERSRIERQYQAHEDRRFGRKRGRAKSKLEDRITQNQRSRNLKNLGRP